MKRCPRSNTVIPVTQAQLSAGKMLCPTCGRKTAISRSGQAGSQILARIAGHNRGSSTSLAALVAAIEICVEQSADYDASDVAARLADALFSARSMAEAGSPWREVESISVRVGTPFRSVPPALDADVRRIEASIITGAIVRKRRGD